MLNTKDSDSSKKKNGNSISVIDRVVFSMLWLVIFLLPIFFLPLTTNPYEFNKQVLLFALSSSAFLLWLIRSMRAGEMKFARTPLDAGVVLFVIAYTLAAIFSKDLWQSLTGIERQGLPSLLSVFGIAFFYFAFVNTVKNKADLKKMLSAFYFSAFAVLLIVLMSAWRVVPVFQGFFNPTQATSALTVYLAASLPLCLASLLNKETRIFRFWIFVLLFFLALIGLNLISGNFGWLIAGIEGALVLVAIFCSPRILSLRINWLWLATLLLVLGILSRMFVIPSLINSLLPFEKRAVIPQTISLSDDVAWDVAKQSAFENIRSFLFGVGPGNFAYSFSRFRPETFNEGPFWQVRFEAPSSNFIAILAEGGWLLAFAWLFLNMVFIVFFIRSLLHGRGNYGDEDAELYFLKICSFAASLGIASASFFSHAPVLLYFLLVFTAAVSVKAILLQGKDVFSMAKVNAEHSLKSAFAASFGFVCGLILVMVFLVFSIKIYIAEAYYAKAAKSLAQSQAGVANEALSSARSHIQKSIAYLPTRPVYYLYAAELSLLEIQDILKQKTVDQNLIASRLDEAVRLSNEAVRREPWNSGLWQRRGEIFEAVSLYAPSARQFAIQSYAQALALEPANPAFYQALGVNKYFLSLDPKTGEVSDTGEMNAAEALIKQAVMLKPNFSDARISLARVYEKKGSITRAISGLKEALQYETGLASADVHYEIGRLLYNEALAKFSKNSADESAKEVGAEKIPRASAEESLAYINNALLLMPNHANALFTRGVIYEATGDIAAAKEDFETLQKNNPDNDAIKQKLESLNGQADKTEAPSPIPEDSVIDDGSNSESVIKE